MEKLSNGKDATLGNHRAMAVAFLGEDSAAVKYLDAKISESSGGANEEVIMPESQVAALLAHIHLSKSEFFKEK